MNGYSITFALTRSGYMVHIVKNDGKVMCNPRYDIGGKTFRRERLPDMLCNRCAAGFRLLRNRGKL